MAQPRPGSLQLPTQDQWDLPSTLFPWTATPSSGYGTEPCTPSTPDSIEDSWTPWNSLKDVCCGLTNSIWGNSTPDGEAAARKTPQLSPLSGKPTAYILGAAESSTRDYQMPIVKRTIVTLDAEQIGPQDQRHHPLDIVKPSSKIFERKPWGVVSNKHTEQIYIADRQHHEILVFGPDGEYQGKFGGPGTKPGLFNRPTGLAFDAAHNRILVVDKDNHRVQALCATTGRFISAFGSVGRKPGQFSFPWGIAVSPDGSRIAVTDGRNHRVQLFTSDGQYLRHFYFSAKQTEHNKTVRNYPRGIVFNNTGTFVYVTDFNLHRIYRLNIVSGKVETIVEENHLFRPSGIDLDADGNIIVCDTRHHLIKIFRANGQPAGYVKKIGDSGLDLPLDITVMRAGHIAVLDLNGRVRIF